MAGRTYTLTVNDLAAAQRLFARSRRKVLLAVWALVFLSLGALVLASSARLLRDGVRPDDWWLAVLIAWAGFHGWTLYNLLWGTTHETRKVFAERRELREPIAVEWSPERITFRTSQGMNYPSWTDFTSWSEDKSTLIMVRGKRSFNFLPKRNFSGDEMMEIRAHLTSAAVKAR